MQTLGLIETLAKKIRHMYLEKKKEKKTKRNNIVQ